MTKKKSLFATLLTVVATLALSCGVLAACTTETPKEKHTITWDYDSKIVTVTAEGYDALPTEEFEETVITITTVPATGYEVPNVTNAKKGDTDGKWIVTVGTKDLTVRVNVQKILNGIEVTANKLSYFEDEEVGQDDIVVTAKYATGDEVVTGWSITYQNGSKFTEGDTKYTVNFGTKSYEVTLESAVRAPLTFESAELEVNDSNQPVLVVKGYYNAEGDVKTQVEAFIVDCMERGTWTKLSYTAEATVGTDKSFTLRMTITGAMKNGGQYYFHIKTGADGENFYAPMANPTAAMGPSNDNITMEILGDPVVAKNGAQYYYGNCENWGNTIMIALVDENATTLQNVGLEVKDGKPYAVFNGTCSSETTEADILNYLIHLDAEDISNGNVKPNGESYVDENAIVNPETISIVIDAEAKTFKVYVLLEGDNVKDGANFFFHQGAQGSDGYYPNVSLAGDENANTITCNGFVFTFKTAADLGLTESWQSSLLYVNVKAAE